MPAVKDKSNALDETLDLKHWTESLGSPLLILIFVLIAVHLIAFVRSPFLLVRLPFFSSSNALTHSPNCISQAFWLFKVMSAQPEGRQLRPGIKRD